MKAQWKNSQRGNSYINRNGFNVVLYRSSGRWAYRIKERQAERSWSKSGFATEDDAKLAAFVRYVGQQHTSLITLSQLIVGLGSLPLLSLPLVRRLHLGELRINALLGARQDVLNRLFELRLRYEFNRIGFAALPRHAVFS